MSTTYTVYLAQPGGARIMPLARYERLEYTLVANGIGTLTLVVNASDLNWRLLVRDLRIEVWRRVDNGPEYLEGETVWFLRRRRRKTTNKVRQIIITAYSATCLLNTRIVAANTNSSQATKTAVADNMMKAVVREQLGSLATDPARSLATYLTIAPDLSKAPSVSLEFARKTVLDVLQDISQASANHATTPTPLYFDIVAIPGISNGVVTTTLEFRTYINQRGVNRTSPSGLSPVVLSESRNNLTDVELEEDFSDEVTSVYARGAGIDNLALVVNVTDSTRLAASVFNRREKFISSQAATAATLTAAATGEVRNGRPRRRFSGRIVDTAATRYGVHWRHGDKVTALDEDDQFDCRADVVSVKVASNTEDIDAQLRLED